MCAVQRCLFPMPSNALSSITLKMSSCQSTVYPPHSSAPPPPLGYPTKQENPQNHPGETKSKGGGFWKGCCAALCCCCVLDACF
ncbi:unnamed protein product [Trifolium pratense]|uniref:Uncharacterized protein n=1 Tax=Trifolium pratense TaxID=57577 RepID=A0ACB0LMU4_TRIPR|nr:unnamed protein product [Trifolium pratense]